MVQPVVVPSWPANTKIFPVAHWTDLAVQEVTRLSHGGHSCNAKGRWQQSEVAAKWGGRLSGIYIWWGGLLEIMVLSRMQSTWLLLCEIRTEKKWRFLRRRKEGVGDPAFESAPVQSPVSCKVFCDHIYLWLENQIFHRTNCALLCSCFLFTPVLYSSVQWST